jgi:hypothetical protein
MSDSPVVYQDIFAPDYSVTGIRAETGSGDMVVITGSYQPAGGGAPQGLLYRGPLTPTDSAGYYYLAPQISGQSVTSSIFYGPDTPFCDPIIGPGNVRVVGSYKCTETGAYDHGLLYQGGYDGLSPWMPLDVPEAVAGAPVGNTIAHSTMGDLVVGNYDLLDKPGTPNGFIYSIAAQSFTVLDIGPLATLYGVWRQGNAGTTSYTMVGGYDDGQGINQAFLLEYDAATGRFGKPAAFTYGNAPGLVTHFEGISAAPDGFTAAAQWAKSETENGAAFAHLVPGPGNSWQATWVDLDAKPHTARSANSVLGFKVIGIYATHPGIQSYVAMLP